MRKHLIGSSAILALVLIACGGSPSTATTTPASTCVNASAAHRAYVVVQHSSGTTVQKCVGFAGDAIDEMGSEDLIEEVEEIATPAPPCISAKDA